MGTNYYAREGICKECGVPKKETHIGKSSFGWTFTFHATDEVRSYKEWIEFLSQKEIKIFDEYDREITLKEFKEMLKEVEQKLIEDYEKGIIKDLDEFVIKLHEERDKLSGDKFA